MKDKIFNVLQRIGRSFMLPIAILPVAGLLLGIGASFTNTTTIATYGLESLLGQGTVLNQLLVVMSKAGGVIFDNLPIIFAMGCAIGMAQKEKEVAALSAGIAFMVMNISINALLTINGQILADGSVAENVISGTVSSNMGITTLQMGVFGGIIIGIITAYLHNKFYKIELPSALSFFSGSKFIPIISTIVAVFVGIVMYFIWPFIQAGIYAMGSLVTGTGYVGTLIFGVIKRALIPFGLHHVFYLPFWQTAVGGTMEIGGKIIEGGQNIFFAQLADPTTVHFSADATRFFSGEFIFMIFGLPGAALAMYQQAKPEKKKIVGGLLLSATITCMLTGITEPIEFSFLFVAPLLFMVQVVLAGSAYMVAHMLNVAVGLTFSGGFLDLLLFGILQGNNKTNWFMIVLAGMVYFVLYYVSFTFLIKKFDLKTPGREDDKDEVKLYSKSDYLQKNKNSSTKLGDFKVDDQIVYCALGLGGLDNIVGIDSCATRLRITVKDSKLVNEELLKVSGSLGVIKKGEGIQVIYGPKVSIIKSNLEEYVLYYNETGKELKLEDLNNNENSNKEVVNNEKNSTTERIVYSPIIGKQILLDEISDQMFREEMIGKTTAIIPNVGICYAPFDGTVSLIYDTLHAIALKSDDGIELLIHIGIDTVKMKGEPFKAFVKVNDKVKKGDKLIEFDIEKIKENGYSIETPVVITNYEDFENIENINNSDVELTNVIFKVK